MTKNQLLKLSPNLGPYVVHLLASAKRFDISTPLLEAHWLAQLGEESGGYTRVREGLNYKVEALLSLFGRHRISETDARRYGRVEVNGKVVQKADEVGIANCLYGGEFGRKNLGNTQPGDGGLFIGRGLKQLTGRDNYTRCSLALYGDDRLVKTPALLEQPEAAALSAGWFWADKKLSIPAAKDDIVAVTKLVNGGDIGLAGRKAWLVKAKAALQ